MESQTNRFRLKPHEIQVIKDLRSKKVNRLIVGDVHLPYTHKNYLQHCISIYNKYNCSEVSFTGDILDSHFSSFHSTSTESHGAKYELDMAIEQVGMDIRKQIGLDGGDLNDLAKMLTKPQLIQVMEKALQKTKSK